MLLKIAFFHCALLNLYCQIPFNVTFLRLVNDFTCTLLMLTDIIIIEGVRARVSQPSIYKSLPVCSYKDI